MSFTAGQLYNVCHVYANKNNSCVRNTIKSLCLLSGPINNQNKTLKTTWSIFRTTKVDLKNIILKNGHKIAIKENDNL